MSRFSDNVKTQACYRQNGRCAMCGEWIDATYEAHHILPRDCGGKDTLENCVILCGECHVYGAHGGDFEVSIMLDMSEFPFING